MTSTKTRLGRRISSELGHLLAWQADWAARPPLESPPLEGQRVVAVSTRPNDETIGAGRLLADARVPVLAVTLSAGDCIVPQPGLDPRDVALRRLDEWRIALQNLGIGQNRAFGLPAGSLVSYEGQIAEALRRLLRPGDIVVAPWRYEPDADHKTAGRASLKAVQGTPNTLLVEYPIWTPLRRRPSDLARLGWQLRRVTCSANASRLRSVALRAYRTQLDGLTPEAEPPIPTKLLHLHEHQFIAERVR